MYLVYVDLYPFTTLARMHLSLIIAQPEAPKVLLPSCTATKLEIRDRVLVAFSNQLAWGDGWGEKVVRICHVNKPTLRIRNENVELAAEYTG